MRQAGDGPAVDPGWPLRDGRPHESQMDPEAVQPDPTQADLEVRRRALVAEFLQRLADEDDLTEEAFLKQHADVPGLADVLRREREAIRRRVAEAAKPEIEGYEVRRCIGVGGQAAVYKALQKSAKRDVAIKILLPGPYASEKEKRRFEREIDILGGLKHPHIVTLYDSGLTRGRNPQRYFAMELVKGAPLDKHVRAQKPTLEAALALFAKVCDAVHHAHSNGLTHRDLKPDNVRITSEGEPKILDFGFARWYSRTDASRVTETDEWVGTLE